MYLKGILQTKQGRELNFEFKTETLDSLKGYKTCWTDNTYNIRSELKINGNVVNTYNVDNFVYTQAFDKMYKDALVTELTEYKLNEFDYESFDEIGQCIEFQGDDFIDWFCDKYGYDGLSRGMLCYDFEWYVDEYISTRDNFQGLINDCFELANGYHCLSQINNIVDGLLDMFINEYEEEKEIA